MQSLQMMKTMQLWNGQHPQSDTKDFEFDKQHSINNEKIDNEKLKQEGIYATSSHSRVKSTPAMSTIDPASFKSGAFSLNRDRTNNSNTVLAKARHGSNYSMKKFDAIDVTNHQLHLARQSQQILRGDSNEQFNSSYGDSRFSTQPNTKINSAAITVRKTLLQKKNSTQLQRKIPVMSATRPTFAGRRQSKQHTLCWSTSNHTIQ